jgi:Tricorn protease C1 domain
MFNKRLVGPCLVALIAIFSLVYQPAQGYKSGPREVYHQAWQLVRDNYYDSNFNNQNWSSWEHRYDGDIHTVADAHKYIKAMLESLKTKMTPSTRELLESVSTSYKKNIALSLLAPLITALRPSPD